MPKVSVIVPVYNTEKYLPRCIDSILAQTFTDFELILVNDGSKDNSGAICDEYAKKDSRIVVIHKENGGANRARETGVNASKGEWITFVDSDDKITKNALELLISNSSDESDIIIGQIDRAINNYNGEIHLDIYRKLLIRGMFPCPVAKLYRKSIFSTEIFAISPILKLGEDHLMNLRLAFNTNYNVKFIKELIYNYTYVNTSTSNSNNRTFEYENMFFEAFLESIPIEYRRGYMSDILYFAYDKWNCHFGYKVHYQKECENSIIINFIIKNDYFSKNFIRKIDSYLIRTKNTWIRFIFISIKKLINRIDA